MNSLVKRLPLLALWLCLAPGWVLAQKDGQVTPASPGTQQGSTGTPAGSSGTDAGRSSSSSTASSLVTTEKEEKKKVKVPKRIYLGKRVKKGYTKTGKGKNATIEQFKYLKKHEDPAEYLPEKYYFDTKKRKIFKARELPEKDFRVLHGPYKKLQGGKVLEEGFFYVGARHGRWERYNKDNILQDKTYYDKGMLRDSKVTYYDAAQQKMKEVIPFEYGEKTGLYLSFYPNGQVHWEGWYEKGNRVGVWTEYYDFRHRRHYQYQYAESGFDEPIEPYLIKEFDRNGNTVWELKDNKPKKPAPKRAN